MRNVLDLWLASNCLTKVCVFGTRTISNIRQQKCKTKKIQLPRPDIKRLKPKPVAEAPQVVEAASNKEEDYSDDWLFEQLTLETPNVERLSSIAANKMVAKNEVADNLTIAQALQEIGTSFEHQDWFLEPYFAILRNQYGNRAVYRRHKNFIMDNLLSGFSKQDRVNYKLSELILKEFKDKTKRTPEMKHIVHVKRHNIKVKLARHYARLERELFGTDEEMDLKIKASKK